LSHHRSDVVCISSNTSPLSWSGSQSLQACTCSCTCACSFPLSQRILWACDKVDNVVERSETAKLLAAICIAGKRAAVAAVHNNSSSLRRMHKAETRYQKQMVHFCRTVVMTYTMQKISRSAASAATCTHCASHHSHVDVATHLSEPSHPQAVQDLTQVHA